MTELETSEVQLERMPVSQFVEPAVSQTKFDREIAEYREQEETYLSRGWILTEARFPVARVLMCAAQLRPAAVILGVEFDYTNYDAEPPSVTLVEPFTNRPFKLDELPTLLKRTVPQQAPFALPPGFPEPPPGAQVMMQMQQPLMQGEENQLPFLCIAGVREYHAHPAHSGDLWELHRESGSGRLVRLLDVIYRYGIEPISDYQFSLQMTINGFVQNVPPE